MKLHVEISEDQEQNWNALCITPTQHDSISLASLIRQKSNFQKDGKEAIKLSSFTDDMNYLLRKL